MATSASFTITVPTNGGSANMGYVDLNVAGSALDGIAQDAPIVINEKHDLNYTQHQFGVLGARVSALNTIRIKTRGINSSSMPTIDVLITRL